MNYSTNKTDILTVAAQNGLHAFVKSLVEGGIDVNASDSRGKNALIAAVSENNIDCVRLLIKTGADVNVSDQHGTTPLMKAAANGHLNITEILIGAGAKVNATDSRSSTPLMHVWFNGNSECIDLLLRSGADVNIVDNVGDTALTRATSKGFVKCVKILIETGADVNVNSSRALHLTALHGHVECLQILLKAGAQVNLLDTTGKTPLINSTTGGHERCVAALVDEGADVNMRDPEGRTALIFSAIWTSVKCMESFLVAGADVNVCCNIGNTALMEVAASTSPELQWVRFMKLLKAGAHVNKVNTEGLNALQSHLARNSSPNKDVMLLLIAAGESYAGARINITEQDLNFSIRVTPEYLLGTEMEANLKNLCRDRIRTHLLNLGPHLNLLLRIPKLELMFGLASYLLYDVSIDDE